MPTFFLPDKGAEEALAADPEVQKNLMPMAQAIAARAAGFANPILVAGDAPTPHIVAELTDEGAEVVTHDSGWHLDEFGNAYNPPNAPLRRGVGAAGHRFEDEPRT